jgi:hypothetical protein
VAALQANDGNVKLSQADFHCERRIEQMGVVLNDDVMPKQRRHGFIAPAQTEGRFDFQYQNEL